MKTYFCFGKNGTCDNIIQCSTCPYFNESGGLEIDTDTNKFINFLLLRSYRIISKIQKRIRKSIMKRYNPYFGRR